MMENNLTPEEVDKIKNELIKTQENNNISFNKTHRINFLKLYLTREEKFSRFIYKQIQRRKSIY